MTRPRSRLRTNRWPANRRPGSTPGRRFALTLALAVLAASGGVAAADQNASQLVTATVFAPAKSPAPDSVSIGALEADPQKCPTYSGPDTGFIGPGGDSQLPASTWPLSSVLACLSTPVSISAVTGVTVFEQAGSPEAAFASQLSRSDLKTPSDFSLVLQSPVISSDGSGIIYNRPSRGASDNSAADQAVAVSPTPFLIDVFEGPPLTVVATASTTKVAPRGIVSFGEVLTPSNQTGLMYDWNFGGAGPDSTSSTPSVRFSSTGSYPVTLQVTDAAGGGGTGTITINVGSQIPAFGGGRTQPGSGKAPKSTAPKGPQESGGATVGAPVGKSKLNADGAAPAHKKQSATTNQPSTRVGKHTAPKPKGAPHRRSSAAPQAPTPPPAFNPAAALVTGRLVSDVRLLAADVSPLVRTTETSVATAPPARRTVQSSLMAALGGALAVVLIFTLGAGRELRGGRRWRVLRASG